LTPTTEAKPAEAAVADNESARKSDTVGEYGAPRSESTPV